MYSRVVRNEWGFYELKEKPDREFLNDYYLRRYFQDSNGGYRKEYSGEEIRLFQNQVKRNLRMLSRLLSGEDFRTFRMLDIGCAEGWALSGFSRAGFKVHGLDFSAEPCRQFHPDLVSCVTAGNVDENLQELVQQQQKFDVIHLTHVLEHVPDPSGFLQRIRPLFAPEGIMLLEVPNDFSFIQQLATGNGLVEGEPWVFAPDHISYFSRESLTRLANHHGFASLHFLSDFPIDIFLLNHESNYYRYPEKGGAAWKAKVLFENHVNENMPEAADRFYEAAAALGLGRSITGFFSFIPR